MIIENLLHFYKKGLSSWDLVFRYMKKSLILFAITCILFFAVFVYLISLSDWLLIVILIPLGFGLLHVSIFFLISTPVKVVLKEKYGISIRKNVFAPFSTKEWIGFRLALLKEFLISNGVVNKELTNDLKNVIIEKVENQVKNYSPLITGITLILFVPVWSAASTRLFRSINDFNTGAAIVGVSLIIIILLNMNVANFKYFIKELSPFSRNQARLQRLKTELTTISYEMSLSKTNTHKNYEFQKKIIDEALTYYYKKYFNNQNNHVDISSVPESNSRKERIGRRTDRALNKKQKFNIIKS